MVTIISDHFKFLTTFYMPSEAIKNPPPEGWPNITAETTDYLGQSPLVIDLIKHLPFIKATSHGQDERAHDIHYKSGVVDYSLCITSEKDDPDIMTNGQESLQDWWDRIEEDKTSDDEESDDDEEYMNWDDNWYNGDNSDNFQMTNMVTLALGSESGGRHIILDVFKGNIYEDLNECDLLSSVPIEDFFEDLREKFEKLELVPTLGGMREAHNGNLDDKKGDEYRKVWREYGWPGKNFRKEEALEAIQECRERIEDSEDSD